jgi:hypothetical protein
MEAATITPPTQGRSNGIVICIPEQQTGKLTSCVATSAMGMYKPLLKQKLNSVFQEL